MNRGFSDFNDSNRIASPVSGGVYRDVSSTFIHLITKRVIVNSDLDAIKNSVKNIVLTRRGGRPFNPLFGTRVPNMLFEPIDAFTARAIQVEIVDGITRWEPRISNLSVQVDDDADSNSYRIRVTFLAQYDIQGEFQFTLNTIR
jgi:phage baseplate assembly protein W